MRWKIQHSLSLIALVLLCLFARMPTSITAQTTSFQVATPINAAWTSATAVGTTVRVSTVTLSAVMLTMNGTGTLTGGQIQFFVSDDPITVSSPTWYPIAAFRVDTGVSDLAINVSPLKQAWQIDTDGWKLFSVQLITPITGSGTLSLRLSATASPGGATAPNSQITSPLQSTLRSTASALGNFMGLIGSFGRRITSHGTALDTYVVNSYDPCQTPNKGNKAISQTTSTVLIAAAQGKRVFVCSMLLITADAEQLSLVEGTGTICAVAVGVVGGTTAGTGMAQAANGGFMLGNGQGTVAVQGFAGADICLLQSGSGRVAGNLTYVWQ